MLHLIGSDVLALMKYYILYISGLKDNIYLESFGGAFFITLATQTAAGKQYAGELPVATSRHRGFRQHWLPLACSSILSFVSAAR